MKIYILVLIIFSFLTLNSCRVSPSSEENVPTPTQTYFSSQKLPLATPSLPIMQTITSSKPMLTEHCLEISNFPLWGDPLSGKLLLASDSLSGNFFLDMITGKRYPLSQDEGYLAGNFNVSPNGDWLAYIGSEGSTSGDDTLVVQAVDGHETLYYPVNFDEWQIIAYWFNNETLVLWNHANPLDNVIFFNPFTGYKEVKYADYPNIIYEDWGWDFSWPSVTIYNPSLKYLVYLAKGNIDGDLIGNQKLILWDLKNGRAVTEVNDFGHTLVRPLWKSDGSGVVYVKSVAGYAPPEKKDNLFFLNLDGTIQQLTELNDYFPYASIFSYSWSPDENLIAFELVTNHVGERKLLILNMSTLEIVDLCLSPQPFTPMIWSPDSRYLAYSEEVTNDSSQTVLVDLVDRTAFVVAEEVLPAGWVP